MHFRTTWPSPLVKRASGKPAFMQARSVSTTWRRSDTHCHGQRLWIERPSRSRPKLANLLPPRDKLAGAVTVWKSRQLAGESCAPRGQAPLGASTLAMRAGRQTRTAHHSAPPKARVGHITRGVRSDIPCALRSPPPNYTAYQK